MTCNWYEKNLTIFKYEVTAKKSNGYKIKELPIFLWMALMQSLQVKFEKGN